MGDNEAIIREFIECWSSLDSKKLASYFAEDGCYHNMPLGPVTGRENIRSFIDNFLKMWTETKWDIINIAWTDNIVIVERLDKTKFTEGNVALPCVGVFEMEAGKIKVWRDYFDMATYMNAMKS